MLACAHVVTPTAFPHPLPVLLLNTWRHTVLILSQQLHGINIHSREERSPAASSPVSVCGRYESDERSPRGARGVRRAGCPQRWLSLAGLTAVGSASSVPPVLIGEKGTRINNACWGLWAGPGMIYFTLN